MAASPRSTSGTDDTTRHTVDIQRPIEDVFAVLTDVTQDRSLVSGARGGVVGDAAATWCRIGSPGTRQGDGPRQRERRGGHRIRSTATGRLKGESASAPFKATLDFSPVSGGTSVAVETTFELHGLMRLVGPLFIGPYERGWDKGLQNLKQMMEAGEL